MKIAEMFYKYAVGEECPCYEIYNNDYCSVFIPYGQIQSVIHVLAVPRKPIYNAVTLNPKKDIQLLKDMDELLRGLIQQILAGGEHREKYMSHIGRAFGREQEYKRVSIQLSQNGELIDTKTCHETAIKKLNDLIEHSKRTEKPDICTSLHIHPNCTVGHLHMHGW